MKCYVYHPTDGMAFEQQFYVDSALLCNRWAMINVDYFVVENFHYVCHPTNGIAPSVMHFYCFVCQLLVMHPNMLTHPKSWRHPYSILHGGLWLGCHRILHLANIMKSLECSKLRLCYRCRRSVGGMMAQHLVCCGLKRVRC